ncbi:hypothetical protein KEM56_004260 [Ascosphaera pollenicola]|nr:hypothetical protein KEM56_004260 [Ascosphaera pollenicola]
MPTDPSTAAAAAAEPTAANPNKRRYSDYLRGVDSRFQHLTEDVLPSAPYLTYPKVQRPINDRWLVNNWCVGDGSVFSRDEEHLQYMTFLSYQDWDTALVAVGGWSDAIGNVMREEKRPPKVDSSTVSDASASAPKTKKKITLSDYNVKKTTIKGTPSEREPLNDDTPRIPKLETLEGAKTPVRHHHTPQENPRANSKHNHDKEEVGRDSSHPEHVSNPNRDTETLSSDSDQKRTRPASPRVKQEKDSHLERPALDTSLHKSPISDTPSTKQPPPSSPDERTLPPLLSPTLPSPLIRDYPRAKEVYGFEPILSRQTSSPEAPLSETSLSLQKKQGSSNGNLDRAAIKPNSSSSATVKPTKSNDVAAHRQNIPSKEKLAVEREDRVKTNSKTTVSDSFRLSKPSQSTRQSRLIVKLKYGRANAQRVIKILKIGQSHRTNTSDAPKASKTIVRGDAPSISSKTVKKRPMQSDNESPRSQTALKLCGVNEKKQ